jgi:hypothetical protein
MADRSSSSGSVSSRKLLAQRAAALARFAKWEANHPASLSPAAAIGAIGALFETLPPASRTRPVDPAGVMAFHQLLSALSERRR